MQKTQTLFSQDLYTNHLLSINNIHFTKREIDVIACVLSARKTSKIAYFLSINTRTVETHLRNIMSKLECNSREGILDFVEASDKIHFLRRYYSLLQIEVIFKKSLKDISKLNQQKSLRCFFMSIKDKDPLIAHLATHLNLVNIKVSSAAREKEGDYVIFILPEILEEERISLLLDKRIQNSNKTLFVLQERKNNKGISEEIRGFDVVDFVKQGNYYFAFFTLLKKLLPNLGLDKIIDNFKDKYAKIYIEPQVPQASLNIRNLKSWFAYQTRYYLIIAFLFIAFISSSTLIFRWNTKNNTSILLRSDIVIPKESILLNRSEFLTQIDKKFQKQGGIQTLALIGPGGSGKTTVARLYARHQKVPILWEINAETPESLKASFEHFARALSKTKDNQKALSGLEKIENSEDKEEKILQFIKECLRSQSNWFLIYDNVEKFKDIQKYLPQDPSVWGHGKIILTTRDENIQNNTHVDNVVLVKELDPNQKLNLFIQVMNQSNDHSFASSQLEIIKAFLENIPPFPLDVSLAAYYLKYTNSSYKNYLIRLAKNDKYFLSMQENILREVGDYTKTRNNIITISLQYIMDIHPDFKELLFFISLFDSQDIPRDLLNKSKDSIVVDNFIANLKKHSLISSESSPSSLIGETLSIHRSAQALTLNYFINTLSKNEVNQYIEDISNSLQFYINDIIESEDHAKLKILINHLKSFLKHSTFLENVHKGVIEGHLGYIYFYLGDFIKAKLILDASVKKLGKFPEKNRDVMAPFFVYLGNIYRELGDYKKSQHFFEQSLKIYKKDYSKNKIKIAQASAFLGYTHKHLRNYKESINFFNESLTIYRTHFSQNHTSVAWVLTFLGDTYIDLGNYEKAKSLLEQSLSIFKAYLPETHIWIAWNLACLGDVYRELGDYQKAKALLEKSVNIYDLHITKTHVWSAWASSYLGNVYHETGDYKKAKNLLENALAVYEKNYGKNHIEIASILKNLGKVYILDNDLNTAESHLHRALNIAHKFHCPDFHTILENLAELYLKKSVESFKIGNIEESKIFHGQALAYLKQSLEAIKTNFPENSVHLKRVQVKIKNLEENNLSI